MIDPEHTSACDSQSEPVVEPSEAWARAADESDPLASFRERFWIPPRRAHADGRPSIYLVGNSLGCMPRAVEDAIARELRDWKTLGVDAHLEGEHPWYSYHEPLRSPGARLVGAEEREVVFMNSLTANLHLMMASFYRPEGDRRRIVIERHAFPSDRYACASQIRWHGHDPSQDLVQLEPPQGERVLRDNDIIDYLRREGDKVALVLLPGVNYLTGQVFDMPRITQAAREAGCRIGWDLAHAAGNIPLRLHDWGPDFACWCSYKYLNAGPGAVAGCFVHECHLEDRDLVRLAGWWGNDPDTRFSMPEEFEPVARADAWALSNPPILSMAPLRVSLAIFDEATMDALWGKSQLLHAFCRALLVDRLGERVRILTPEDRFRRGCQLSLVLDTDARRVHDALHAQGIICDFRAPDVIRIAPVPLYNTFADVYGFVDALVRTLS